MTKTKFPSLTASLVLATTLTLSCEDKEKDKPATAAETASVAEVTASPPETAEKTVPDKQGTFTDSRDSKTYKKVTIGTQTWMAENLNFAAKGSKCYDDNPGNCAKYGRLYDWNVENTKPCPAGWHLSTYEEWQTLLNYAGGWETAGKKLKSTSGWQDNGGGTDDYGFSALPGGKVSDDGSFNGSGSDSYWWCVTGITENGDPIWGYEMGYNGESVSGIGDEFGRMYFFSVRCIQN